MSLEDYFVHTVQNKYTADLRGLTSLYHALSQSGPLQEEILDGWQAIYAGFIQERFDRFSRGGGDWAPLKPATIRAKRNKSEGILVDTGLVKTSLSPVIKGAYAGMYNPDQGRGSFHSRQVGVTETIGKKLGIIKDKSFHGLTMTLGFGGNARYPNGTSVSDVAMFHQDGAGNLPQRKILVSPDAETIKIMKESAHVAIQRYYKKGSSLVPPTVTRYGASDRAVRGLRANI